MHETDDLFPFQLVGDIAMHALRNLRRRQEDVRLLAIGLRPATQMRELGEYEASVMMHGVGDGAVCRDDGVVVVGDLLPGRRRRRGVNARGAAEDREGAAAPRLGFVVSPQPLAGSAALGHGLRVARRVDAILERETADPNRREQRTKLGGHPFPPMAHARAGNPRCPSTPARQWTPWRAPSRPAPRAYRRS